MWKYYFRNSFVLASLIFITYIIMIFYNGKLIHEKIQGEWINIKTLTSIIFNDTEYISDNSSGTYKIRANKIIFDNGDEYIIGINRDYITIDEQILMKR